MKVLGEKGLHSLCLKKYLPVLTCGVTLRLSRVEDEFYFILCHDNFSISNFQFSYCSLFPAVCALLLLEEQQNNIEIRNKNGQVPVEREKYLL